MENQLTGNVRVMFPFNFCSGCSHCEPVIEEDTLYTNGGDVINSHLITCHHAEACGYIFNVAKVSKLYT